MEIWSSFNWQGVATGAILAFVAVWVWYGPLFAGAWRASQQPKPTGARNVWLGLGVELISLVPLGIAVGLLIEINLYANPVWNALFAATIMSLCLGAILASQALWERQKHPKPLIDIGAQAVLKSVILAFAYLWL